MYTTDFPWCDDCGCADNLGSILHIHYVIKYYCIVIILHRLLFIEKSSYLKEKFFFSLLTVWFHLFLTLIYCFSIYFHICILSQFTLFLQQNQFCPKFFLLCGLFPWCFFLDEDLSTHFDRQQLEFKLDRIVFFRSSRTIDENSHCCPCFFLYIIHSHSFNPYSQWLSPFLFLCSL